MCCYYLVKHVGAELRCAYQVTRMTRKSDRLTEVRTARDGTGDYVRLVGDGGSFDVEEHHFTKTTRTARYAYGEDKPVVGEMEVLSKVETGSWRWMAHCRDLGPDIVYLAEDDDFATVRVSGVDTSASR